MDLIGANGQYCKPGLTRMCGIMHTKL